MQLFSFPNQGKTFFLPSNKLSEWERTAAQPMENTCSLANEKPASPQVLLCSSELSFSLLMTFFPCPALLNNIPLPCCVNSSEYLCLMRCCPIHESFNKASQIFKFTQYFLKQCMSKLTKCVTYFKHTQIIVGQLFPNKMYGKHAIKLMVAQPCFS